MINALQNRVRTAPIASSLLWLVAFALMAPGVASAAPAEETLTGQLATNDAGRFVLLEEKTGNAIVLESDQPQQLADHQSARVSLTGQWSGTREIFRVSTLTVEPAAETAGGG